ncbi:MAG: hypothetical protein J6P40_10035 [Oscillospiraceae bacterium]|nr:hypothetical protein [Oscillospiraceae bacterium]
MEQKPLFEVKIQHDEDTLVALAHMQYDLFCTRNRVARSILSAFLILIALLYGGGSWWSLLIIAYACYLTTTTYAASNRTAHKLTDQLKAAKMPFPSSRYLFEKDAMHIITMPDGEEMDPLPYDKVLQLGEDFKAYYLFRDQYGGYRIPKEELGEKENDFRTFVQNQTGKKFIRRLTPLRRLRMWLDNRANEPEHL